ncbi:MAG: hypothetical protein ACKVJ5_16825, partial [Pseudoalteromonas sp.]
MARAAAEEENIRSGLPGDALAIMTSKITPNMTGDLGPQVRRHTCSQPHGRPDSSTIAAGTT